MAKIRVPKSWKEVKSYPIREALICWTIAAAALYLLLTGCAAGPRVIKGECRHEATYARSVFGEQLGYWRQDAFVGLHSQAQAFVDGQWRWLCVDFPLVYQCSAEPRFFPDRYFTFLEWQWQMVRLK